jgi:hypothetical protein
MMQQMGERLQIGETQDSASSREYDKRVGWGQSGSGGGQKAETPGSWVMEEEPCFPPGQALDHEGKLLAGGGVEGIGHRENKLSIRVMGCSWRFVHMAFQQLPLFAAVYRVLLGG